MGEAQALLHSSIVQSVNKSSIWELTHRIIFPDATGKVRVEQDVRLAQES